MKAFLIVTPDGAVRAYGTWDTAEWWRKDDEILIPTPTTVAKINTAHRDALATRVRIQSDNLRTGMNF